MWCSRPDGLPVHHLARACVRDQAPIQEPGPLRSASPAGKRQPSRSPAIVSWSSTPDAAIIGAQQLRCRMPALLYRDAIQEQRCSAERQAAIPGTHREDVLLPRRGSLWRCRSLARSPLGPVEGVLDGLPSAESHCLAGCNFDRLSALWVAPLARGPCRHIESAEAGDTDRLSSYERIDNGVYDRLHGVPRRRLV